MQAKQHYILVGDLLQERAVHYMIAYGGILYDGLIIPALLWKPTRKIAFIASVFFHLFNSFVFQVGIFPYLALAFFVFFFEPKTIQKLFLKRKAIYIENKVETPSYAPVFKTLFVLYFVVQIALPVRHYFIQDSVLWTEEGHRLSWRMMLRTKRGNTNFRVVDKATNAVTKIRLKDYLSRKQIHTVSTKPDVMWQFAQRLKDNYAKKGIEIEVYVSSFLSVNGKPSKRFINSEVDLANIEWDHFNHHDWILPSNQDENH